MLTLFVAQVNASQGPTRRHDRVFKSMCVSSAIADYKAGASASGCPTKMNINCVFSVCVLVL